MVESDVVTNDVVDVEPVAPPHTEAHHLTGCSLTVKVLESVFNTTLTVHSRVQGQGVMSRFVRSTDGELRAVERALQTEHEISHPRIVGCRARWAFPEHGLPLAHVIVTVSLDGRTVKGKGVHVSHTFAMALAYENARHALHLAPEASARELPPVLLPNPFLFSS